MLILIMVKMHAQNFTGFWPGKGAMWSGSYGIPAPSKCKCCQLLRFIGKGTENKTRLWLERVIFRASFSFVATLTLTRLGIYAPGPHSPLARPEAGEISSIRT